MKLELIENNPLLKQSIEFSLLIIEYCEQLEAQRKFIISNQLLKSATSIGANSMEAQNAESKADFIHKIKIAAKEADETQYWLILCQKSGFVQLPSGIFDKLEALTKILGSILSTSKKKSPFSYLLSFFIL